MAFALSWLGRSRADGREQAEAALPAVYTAALRLTGGAAQAEVLVESAYGTYAARGGRRRSARVRFELLDALYASWRQGHGSPVGARTALRRRSPADPPAGPLSLERVAAAVDALPDTFWHPIWLRDNQGLGYEEIALLLDISTARVASLVSQARRELILTLRCGCAARHGG